MCGTKIELGMHSYRAENHSGQYVFCINCSQKFEPTISGLIFSCNSCGENVCNMCAEFYIDKHYCPKCFKNLPAKRIDKAKPSVPVKYRSKPRKKGKAEKRARIKEKARGKGKVEGRKRAQTKRKSSKTTKAKQKSKSKKENIKKDKTKKEKTKKKKSNNKNPKNNKTNKKGK